MYIFNWILFDYIIFDFSGSHRPLWPKYGEYVYVPPQRWIHNLEHGAIVALYHPCANHQEVQTQFNFTLNWIRNNLYFYDILQVNKLKSLIKKCLYRHIITPYALLSSDKPFALVAWGKSLELPIVDTKMAIGFIRMNALQGAEQIARDGEYNETIVEAANILSANDSALCPNM